MREEGSGRPENLSKICKNSIKNLITDSPLNISKHNCFKSKEQLWTKYTKKHYLSTFDWKGL